MDRPQLSELLADREASRVIEYLPPGNSADVKEVFLHLAAQATLCGGIPSRQSLQWLQDELDSMGTKACAKSLAVSLRRALPVGDLQRGERSSDKGGTSPDDVAPIQPDIVGEVFVWKYLGRSGAGARGKNEILEALQRGLRNRPRQVVQSLVRMAQDLGAVTWLDDLLTKHSEDASLLRMIEAEMPERTAVLRSLAVRTTARLVEIRRKEVHSTGNGRIDLELGRLLRKLSRRLAGAEEALAPAQESVEILTELAKSNADVQSDVAAALQTLADRLGQLDMRAEALSAAEEAAALTEKLTARDRVHAPAFAMALQNLAVRLRESGRRAQALSASKRSVKMIYRLAKSGDAREPDLAVSLHSLAQLHGPRRRALPAIRAAVEIMRKLARNQPDAFEYDLAVALRSHAVLVGEISRNAAGSKSGRERREEAVELAKESAEILGKLAIGRIEVFRLDHAIALHNLSNRLSETGEYEKALESARNAVEIMDDLSASRPSAYSLGLAGSLQNLAARLGETKKDGAVSAACQAVKIVRGLGKSRPGVLGNELARSFTNLATALLERGDAQHALKACGRSLALLPLTGTEESPSLLRAWALRVRGRVLQVLGRTLEAEEVLEEASGHERAAMAT